MSTPITARLNGDDYQARHFWLKALDMLDPRTDISAVAYEWSELKSFDDILIEYDTPRIDSESNGVKRHYIQVKWQTSRKNRIGYQDLVDPQFINASSVSLLERLAEAKKNSVPSNRFSLVTTAKILDGDPLAKLVSNDTSLLDLKKLAVGKTERSEMGAVRSCWRNALGLESDQQLFGVLSDFAILDNQDCMEVLRERVEEKAKSVGVSIGERSSSVFHFDALARQIMKRGKGLIRRNDLIQFLNEEGVSISPTIQNINTSTAIAIESFKRLASITDELSDTDKLSLLDFFEGRYLKSECYWQVEIKTAVESFLTKHASSQSAIRLTLDAHAAIAFMSGQVLHQKSGVQVELVQNGRRGKEIWHAHDETKVDCTFDLTSEQTDRDGTELAVAISVSQSVLDDVKQYISESTADIGTILHAGFKGGAGQSVISSGAQAGQLSDQLATKIRQLRRQGLASKTHLFVSAPNSFVFLLGQHFYSLKPCQMYEFDFDGDRGGKYFPTL